MEELVALPHEGAIVSGIGSLHGARIRTADESKVMVRAPLRWSHSRGR